jgi:hypothetical protein
MDTEWQSTVRMPIGLGVCGLAPIVPTIPQP